MTNEVIDQIVAMLRERRRNIELQIARYEWMRPKVETVPHVYREPAVAPSVLMLPGDAVGVGENGDDEPVIDRNKRRRAILGVLIQGNKTIKALSNELGQTYRTIWGDLHWLKGQLWVQMFDRQWRATEEGIRWHRAG